MKKLVMIFLAVLLCGSIWAQNRKVVWNKSENQTEKLSYDKQDRLDGTSWVWNADSVKIAEANYLHGVKHGVWRIWYDNGQLAYQMFYSQGEKVGTWKHWNTEGKLVTEKHYR